MSATSATSALELVARAKEQWATKHLAIASFTFVLYDVLLTLGEEKRHIWSTHPRISLVKALFYINRYFTPITLFVNLYTQFDYTPSPLICRISGKFVSVSGVLTFIVVEAVLMLRVWALYGRGRWVARALIGVLILSIAAYAICLGISFPQFRETNVSPLPGIITGCAQFAPPSYFAVFGITLVVEAALFAMTLIKVLRDSRTKIRLPVIQHLLTSGSLYFFVIFLSFTFTIIAHFLRSAVREVQLPGANSSFSIAVSTTACSRLILSIRDLYQPEFEEPTFHTELVSDFVPPRDAHRDDFELEDRVVRIKETRFGHQPWDDEERSFPKIAPVRAHTSVHGPQRL